MNKKNKIIHFIILAALLVSVQIVIISCGGPGGHLQSKNELLTFRNATASKVLSAEGELIGKFYLENRTNVSYSQLPPYLINALVATEDARFFEHKGVDSRSLARVLFKTVLLNRRSSGGGSTITQQLAKNMYGRKATGKLAILINKIREIILAHRLEKAFSKEEIITLYLNTVPYGENIFGIQTAALRYFNKNVGNLNIEESAVLVGMLKAPSYYDPALHPRNATNRRNIVLGQMEKNNYLKSSVADSLCKLPLKVNYNNAESAGIADYFLVQVENETKKILQNIYSSTGKKWNPEVDGLVITTTLNLKLQTFANSSFHEHLPVMQKRLSEQFRDPSGKKLIADIAESRLKEQHLLKKADKKSLQSVFDWNGSYADSLTVRDSIKHALTLLHAGLLAMDPQTGAVRAWVGGIDFSTQQYDQILARRQLGSVFKPILYAAALENGMEPCQYLDNDSIVLSGFRDWSPENYDHSFGGKYSLAGALAQSMNIPTFSLYLKTGFDKLDSLWTNMGFSFPLDNTPSLALGTAEASIKEIAVAYSAFANGGNINNPQVLVSIATADGDILYRNDFSAAGHRVLTEKSCILMNAMLQKAIREGTGASLKSTFGVTAPFAGKTGTSQNYADAWFAAYNPEITVVARVGASSPAIHFTSGSNGTGSALALPLVALTLKKAETDPVTRDKFIVPFPELPPELAGALDCPDFKQDTFIDNFLDLFKKKEIIFEKDSVKGDRKLKAFFKRLFGK